MSCSRHAGRRAIGLTDRRIPITQQHIADTLGLSLVHTNRTLGRLIRDRVIRWKEHEFEILNRNRLSELAGDVDPATMVRPLL